MARMQGLAGCRTGSLVFPKVLRTIWHVSRKTSSSRSNSGEYRWRCSSRRGCGAFSLPVGHRWGSPSALVPQAAATRCWLSTARHHASRSADKCGRAPRPTAVLRKGWTARMLGLPGALAGGRPSQGPAGVSRREVAQLLLQVNGQQAPPYAAMIGWGRV